MEMIIVCGLVAVQVVALVLAADLMGGFFHWLEDAYGDPDMPVLGARVIRPNILHHHHPRLFLKNNWWQSSWDLLLVAAVGVVVAGWAGVLTWRVGLFAALTANMNQFHKWGHGTRKENGPVVTFLQGIRLLQTVRQHSRHHTDPKDSAYCVVTDVLNPVLDRIRFWATLESFIWKTTGIRRRPDTSVRGQGPAPQWVSQIATHRN